MQELTFSPATAILLVVIVVAAFFAIRRMVTRGTCDCHDHCGDKSTGCPGCSGCSHGIIDIKIEDDSSKSA